MMARRPRIVVPGQALHIIQRGNNRQPVFFSEEDYIIYLDVLRSASRQYQCAVHAYVLMTNHVHLLMTPITGDGPSQLMQSVGRSYVRFINGVYGRTGTLWEGRFKSALIDSECYLFTCSRYIELNPVRAGMVQHPGDFRWSSYQHNAIEGSADLVSVHELYKRLGETDEERRKAYRGLFTSHIDDIELEAIREKTDKGGVLGKDRFRSEIEVMLGRRVSHLAHGGDRRSKRFREPGN